MSAPILATKLFIPVSRPEQVSRPHLIEQLNSGLHGKLTLISAPAGFGKTTLITEWLNHLKPDSDDENLGEIKTAWLSLDHHDNDPVRFLTYFITALKRIDDINPDFGTEALSMLHSPQPLPPETVLTALINDIAICSLNIVLVLDDYHLISTQAIHDALSYFIENQPPRFHLVIATREDPLLPLSRLRARSQLTELRATEMRFTRLEAAEFLNKIMGLDLNAEDIAALEARTEGWIAGLQLAAISLRGQADPSKRIQSFTGSNRLVLDYLIEEVLHQQSDEVQNFLLQTAILDRLTGSLCDRVRETSSSSERISSGQEILEMLDRVNLFIIPLDDERCWFRYHHLFADLLRKRLSQIYPNLPNRLHSEASAWYEEQGFNDDAIEHALNGKDFGHAAEIIERQIDDIWGAGQHAVIQRWMAKLPQELVYSLPNLSIFHAWYLFVNGQREVAKQALQAAERALTPSDETSFDDRTDTPSAERVKLLGRAAAVQAFMASYRGDIDGIIQHARRADEWLPNQDLTWRSLAEFVLGDALLHKGEMDEAHQVRLAAVKTSEASGHYYLILVAKLRLAETLRHQGKLTQVIDLCDQIKQFVNKVGISQTVAAGWLLALCGDVLVERNDLDQAVELAQEGVVVAGRGGRDVAFVGWSNLYLLRVLFSSGELSIAEDVIAKMQGLIKERDFPVLVPIQINAWQARIWLQQGKLDAVAQWADELKLDIDGELTFYNDSEFIVFARYLLTQGKLDQSIHLLGRLFKLAESGGRTLRSIEIRILEALALQKGDQVEKALSVLEDALRLSEPEGFIRIFVDEGPSMARLLYEALSREIAPNYVRQLLAAFPDVDTKQTATTEIRSSDDEWIEPLSERELEVLQLIAKGLTNREVGARLYLTQNTVKAHARTIYSKLGVNNRTQAVNRARTLGLISDS